MLKACNANESTSGFSKEEGLLLAMAAEAADRCAGLDDAVKKRGGSEDIIDTFNPADHYSLQVD